MERQYSSLSHIKCTVTDQCEIFPVLLLVPCSRLQELAHAYGKLPALPSLLSALLVLLLGTTRHCFSSLRAGEQRHGLHEDAMCGAALSRQRAG